uniref:Uncharacterized protein n=1 Tax=Lepeophtheirus salmonis TaxID=72036 RepID=A0A0K2T647_LEPSM
MSGIISSEGHEMKPIMFTLG